MVSMRTLNGSVLSVAALLAVLVIQPAQAAPVGGDHEVEIAGGFFHAQGSDAGSLNVDLQLGHYLSPGWEIGFRQAVNYNFIDDARDQWIATTTPFLAYNFHFNEHVIPFVSVAAGAAWNDQDATGTLGPGAGLKIFLSDQTFLGLRYRYEWFFSKFKRIDNNADQGNHVGTIGIGFVWGGERKPTK
jgi:hypothetical protein